MVDSVTLNLHNGSCSLLGAEPRRLGLACVRLSPSSQSPGPDRFRLNLRAMALGSILLQNGCRILWFFKLHGKSQTWKIRC